MQYLIDETNKKAVYIQMYELLRRDIVAGVYEFGGKLPSKRTLAYDSGVSIITVEHAVEMLIEEGYVEPRERSGYFVIYKKSDFGEEPALSSATTRKINHISSETEDISVNLMSKTMRKVLLDYGEQILEKSPNKGCIELRDAIRKYLYRSRGILVENEQIFVGSGAEYLYGIISGLFADKKNFVIESPCYEKIPMVYESNGKNIIPLKLESRGIPTRILNQTTGDILHVTPFHSFPTGATADVSKRNEYIQWAKKNNAYIIEDNFDSELTVSRKTEESLLSMDDERIIYLNTFSKTIANSIRVGYMILPGKLLPLFEEKYGKYSCTVPVFEQLFLAELINSGNFERHINRIRRARRNAITEHAENKSAT